MRTSPAVRLLVVLAVPALLAATGPAHALLRCAIDGGVRTHCCCPDRAAPEGVSLSESDACCCTAASEHAQPMPPSAPRAEAGFAHAARIAGATVALPEPRAAMHAVPPAAGSRQAALGPPLVLLKSSLLI